jgi:YD repeat-containing protein
VTAVATVARSPDEANARAVTLGGLPAVTDAAGNSSTFTYDPTGLLNQELQPVSATSGITTSFGYDTAGNLTTASTTNTLGTGSNATSETFTYNDRREVLTATGTGGSSTLGYNGDGLLTSVADTAGTTSYTYDNDDRLATLGNPVTGATATYSYNADSLVSGISYGSGKDTQSFGYDSRHRLTSDALKTSSGTAVASVSYGYNADSEVTSENTAGLAGAASSTYTYDEADRLTSWNNGSTTTSYGYDKNGNLTQFGSKAYTYDGVRMGTRPTRTTQGRTSAVTNLEREFIRISRILEQCEGSFLAEISTLMAGRGRGSC